MNFKENTIAIVLELKSQLRSIFKTYKTSNKEYKSIITQIKTKGYYVIENCFTDKECDAFKNEIDILIKKHEKTIWVDDAKSDHRIYGSDKVSDLISTFYKHSKINDILQAYEGSPYGGGFTLAAKLQAKKDNLGSGGGWHRDFAAAKQTKAIMYLTDTKEGNGPFQYIKYSHKANRVFKLALKHNFSFLKSRFSAKEMEKVLKIEKKNLKTFTAKKGTVLLVDTRGLHRGKPIEEGERYALTNYNWLATEVPSHIKKLFV